jgi:hypothetical protein
MNTTSAISNKNDLTSSLSRLISDKSQSNNNYNYNSTSIQDNVEGSSITNYFANITWQTWLIIILILALLGINIFAYLAKATTGVSGIINKYLSPIVAFFGFSVLETTKQTVSTSATGTKAGVDLVANTTTGAIDSVESIATTSQKPIAQKAVSSQKGSMPVNESVDEWNQSALDSALNDASKSLDPEPDESLSSVQSSSGKAGWCYIGVDRDIRTCSKIGVNDQCMSGDIFPSQDICMNPNLRP